jgi:integrase
MLLYVAFCANFLPTDLPNNMPTKIAAPSGVWIENRTGRKSPFLVCWRDPLTKKPKSLSFKKSAHAQNYKNFLVREQQNHGREILHFNPIEWKEWLSFRNQLEAISPDLSPNDLLEHYRRSFSDGPADKLSTQDVAQEFIEHTKQRWERQLIGRDRYIHVKNNIGRFSDSFERILFREIQTDDINEWLDDLSQYFGGVTLKNHIKDVRSLYRWALDRRKANSNPAALVEAPLVAHKEKRPMPVSDAKKLLKLNFQTNPEGIGRLVCEMFAGLRYSSASRLQKSDINFEDKGILLPAAKLKTGIRSGRRHYITGLPDTLWEWLKLTPEECWSMSVREYLKWKSTAFQRAKVSHPANILRHTAATYLLYATQDPPKVSAILCHRDSNLLWNTYKGNATERAGKEYLSLTPQKVLN